MSIVIRINADDEAAQKSLRKLKKGIEGPGGQNVIRRVAYWTLVRLVKRTPKRYTGQVRRSWHLERVGRSYLVTNLNKVMTFLEGGTKAHGPKTAKFLYVPLNKKAAFGGGNLKFGTDYVLTKRVKGIKAMKIVERQRPKTAFKLRMEMYLYLRSLKETD